LENIFKKHRFSQIIHLAASSKVHSSKKNSKLFFENNVRSTKNILKVMKIFFVKKIIFASSAAVYGNINFKRNLLETSMCRPINLYGRSKLDCEKKIINTNKKIFKFNYVVLRFFNVVGFMLLKKFHKNKPKNLFDVIVDCIKKKKKLNIYGDKFNTKDGTSVRDYIHIYDLVRYIYEISIKLEKEKKNINKILNIGYGFGLTTLEFVNYINKFLTNKIKYNIKKSRLSDPSKSVANIKKLNNFIIYKPRFLNIVNMCKNLIKNMH